MNKKLPAVPYLLWMAVFILLPLGLVVYFAVTDPAGRFTVENISAVGQYVPVILNSIWLAAISTVICLLIGYPLAFLISRMEGNHQRTMVMLIMLPMWMSFLLRTYAWMTLLEQNGVINTLLGYLGLGPFRMINTQGAVILGMVYNFLPFMILPLYSVMVKIDKSVIEAAQDLGANSMGIMGRVVIPLTIPGITTGIIQVFVPSISTFVISKMLGGGSTMLIGDLIELQFLGGSYNLNLGSAISLVLMVIVLLMMALTNVFDDMEDKEAMFL